MTTLVVCIILVSVGMLLLAVWIFRYSRQARIRELMVSHFREVLPNGITVAGVVPGAQQTPWHQFKTRASIYIGFDLQKKHAFLIPAGLILIGMIGWLIYGLAGATLIAGITLFTFGFLLPYSRLRRRQAQTIAQIPLFIDQLLRSLSTGRSLESAIRFAANESVPPLRYVVDRVTRAADLGADMVENLTEAAKLHNLRELNLIALAMRISNQYGGSPRDMLDSIVKMVRQQELARRELAAMTGETRMSAWVLGTTPLAIAIYIMVMNPTYLNMLLDDPTGKTLLMTALMLQGVGAFILWRMLRSV
ncbi:MAG TPA: type II secretion system F family protein [Methylophilus sp.]|uniref:type II secretion system F family protein n=1 Tax=Methylophilus sp. TaxID=29541 RepID=UPI002B8C0E03|nr:type II secretion system F family protein [Methylophilus sp.]HSH87178.1 type II secretion system F family protein [Methylophilus sp.]